MQSHAGPPYYLSRDGHLECITVLEALLTPEEFTGYLRGTALAYLWREGRKDAGPGDAQKAMWFCARLAQEREKDATGRQPPIC